ncbi:MAG TPA: group III truncated hemoglobin [Flavobacteriaceae bacterium]|nr:group III truncated hemoglobin [Flavobacteriaceae bacterium]
MIKDDINTREDVALLVDQFYKKVRANAILGPIFNQAITNWDQHLDHLTTFWESSLFMGKPLKKKYIGNPLEVHVKVDQENNNSITEHHFGIWLNLWFETLEHLFAGENAELAKRRARKMGTFIHLKIFEARQQNS